MIKSDCENIQNFIPLYIDNMLSEEEHDILCEHITNCKSCREELAFMQAILAKTAKLPEIPVSPEFHNSLMKQVQKEPAKTRKRVAFGWKSAASFVAAAAVVALSVVSFLSLDKDGGNQNPDVYLASPAPDGAVEKGLREQETAENIVQETVETAEAAEAARSAAPAEKTEKTQPQAAVAAKEETGKQPSAEPKQTADEQSVSSGEIAADAAADAAHAPAVARVVDSENHADSKEEPAADAPEEKADIKTWSKPQETIETDVVPESTGNSAKTSGGGSSGGSAGGGGAASGGSSAAVRFSIATVTVSEQAIAQAKEILSAFAKDSNGYKVGASLQAILSKLSELDGYRVSVNKTTEISGNYIVLK